MTTTFVPPAMSLELDVSYDIDNDTLLEALDQLVADLDTITYRVVNISGPAAGWPVVRFVGAELDMYEFALRYSAYDHAAAQALLEA